MLTLNEHKSYTKILNTFWHRLGVQNKVTPTGCYIRQIITNDFYDLGTTKWHPRKITIHLCIQIIYLNFFSDCSTCLLQLLFLFLADFNDGAIKSIEIQVSDHFNTLLLERYQSTEVMYVDE